ncbi:MAG: aminotransferase class III-fold pyridoxal phosphate-dependent enzyme [Thermoanaerobaculales bacterium]|jgi:acetylornithine/succinyldiaminopimelate/putrescine aminotransferase|nr:aminotransferase class III-fold pyridoxal phosphate-dependent enzyme [Thermoanaerobaculales bacterium]
MLSTTHPAEVPAYGRLELRPDRGSGCTLVADDGRRFLDLYGGHAVAVSGHCHHRVVAAVREQAERLLFYSNAVPLESRDRLFALLAEMAPAALDQAFLVNSGAETNDVALQLARRATKRRRVVTFDGGFHGRTLATLAVSGIPRYRELADASGGQSLLDLSVVAPWGRPEVLPAVVDETVAAVIVEPVQGLAGAREAGAETLEVLRRACDDSGAVLIFDEVQCGCGRTGAFTAAQSYGVKPDILTLAKGIAAGLPMGAVLLSPRIARHVRQGDLGTTFGGGPIPCAAAAANLEVIRDEDLAARALGLERRLRQGLAGLRPVRKITGRGLLLGLVLDRPARPVQLALFERGILVGSADDPAVIRLLPPLVLADDEADRFLETLHEVLS